MREFPFNIAESFRQGLRPEDNFLTQEGYLEVCYNMIPTPAGLESPKALTDPFSGGVTVDPPFPQVFRGRDLTLSFSSTSVSEVSTGSTPWTLSGVSVVSTNGSSGTIPEGGPWHFVDLGPSFYAFNGAATVFRPGFSILRGSPTTTYVETSVKPQTGCEHKGRIFIGGLDKSSIWNADWQEIFAEWEAAAGDQNINYGQDGPGPSWIMWSSIGGGDFPLWLFYPEGNAQLNIGPTKQEVIRRIKRNEFGWAPLRMNGTVQVLKPLGEHVVAYGDEGIEVLLLQGNRVGFRKLANFGVKGRGTVAGDLDGHIFLDAEGNLWSLGTDLQLSRLGYEEWLSGFSATSTVMTQDPLDRQVYISDPQESFILTQNGLAEIPRRLTSLIPIGGTAFALYSSASTTDITVTTGAHDNRLQAIKQIHDLHIRYQDITDLQVTVYYRYDHTSAYSTFGPVPVNREGVAYIMLSARDFKFELSGTPGSNPRIDHITARWNLVDKRAVRGPFGEG